MSLTGESEKIQNLKDQIALLEKELWTRDRNIESLKKLNDQLTARNKVLKHKLSIIKKAMKIMND